MYCSSEALKSEKQEASEGNTADMTSRGYPRYPSNHTDSVVSLNLYMNFAVKMDVSLQAQSNPLSTQSAFSYIPPRRGQPEDMSYFHQESKVPEVSMYDRVYHQAEGYDMKLHRDDRKHSKGRGLDINKEEKSRAVPVLSSSEYGHRPVPALDQTGRQYARVACIRTEFFMKNGIIWNVAEGYGSVAPI